MDLVSSGSGRSGRPATVRRRRGLRVAAVVLVVAVAVVLLRSTVDTPPAAVNHRVQTAAPTPAEPPRAVPPFDRRPGRTPIPAPTRADGRLTGALPAAGGGPDKAAAVRAVGLVLGRYCDDPRAYAYTLGSTSPVRPEDWRQVVVLLFELERGGNTPSLRLELSWTGPAYRWSGPAALLDGC